MAVCASPVGREVEPVRWFRPANGSWLTALFVTPGGPLYTPPAMKVSLFITCLTDTFYPRSGIALVKVLEHLGCAVDFPAAQTCCGQPMWNNGFHADAG